MFCLAGGWFPILASLLIRKCCSETAWSRQGRAGRRGVATPDGEGRSEMIEEEGKQMLDSGSISETRASETDALSCVNHGSI